MNKELIRKLYSEATVWCEENAIGTPVAWEFEERFAELIVRECSNVCLAERDPSNLNYKPSEKFADAINQHFGVTK